MSNGSTDEIFTPKEMSLLSGVIHDRAYKWCHQGFVSKILKGKAWQENWWSLRHIFEVQLFKLLGNWGIDRKYRKELVRGPITAKKFLFISQDEGSPPQYAWEPLAQKGVASQQSVVLCVNLAMLWGSMKVESAKVLAKRSVRVGKRGYRHHD